MRTNRGPLSALRSYDLHEAVALTIAIVWAEALAFVLSWGHRHA